MMDVSGYLFILEYIFSHYIKTLFLALLLVCRSLAILSRHLKQLHYPYGICLSFRHYRWYALGHVSQHNTSP